MSALQLGVPPNDAWEAAVFVRESQLRARAALGLADAKLDTLAAAKNVDDALVAEARRKIAQRRPAPTSAAKMLFREPTPSVEELLAHGFAYAELAASGASLKQMLERLSFAQLRSLGCTYETLLAANAANTLSHTELTLAAWLEFASLSALVRDGVVRTVETIISLKLSAPQLASQGITTRTLMRPPLNMRVITMAKFEFTLHDWCDHLKFSPTQLGELGFRNVMDIKMRDCALLRFDITQFDAFARGEKL